MISRSHLDEHADKVLLLRMRRVTDDPARALKLYSADGKTLSLPQLHAAMSSLNVGLTQLETQELIRRYPSADHLALTQRRYGLGRQAGRPAAGASAEQPALRLDISGFVSANGGTADASEAAPSRFLAFTSDSLVIASAGMMPDRVPRGAACRKVSPQRPAGSLASAALASRLVAEGGVLVSKVADASLDEHTRRAIASKAARGALDAVGGAAKWAVDASPSYVASRGTQPWLWGSPPGSPSTSAAHSSPPSGAKVGWDEDEAEAERGSAGVALASAGRRVPHLALPHGHGSASSPTFPAPLSLDDIASADESRWADDSAAAAAAAAAAHAAAHASAADDDFALRTAALDAALPSDAFSGAAASSRRGGSNPVLLRTVAAHGGHVPAAVVAGIAASLPSEPLGGALNGPHAALQLPAGEDGAAAPSFAASTSSGRPARSGSASPDPYSTSRWRSRIAAEAAAANALPLPGGGAAGNARAVAQVMLSGSGVAERLAADWVAVAKASAAAATSPSPARFAAASAAADAVASAATMRASGRAASATASARAAAVASATAAAAAKQEAVAAAAAERVRAALRSALPPSARHAQTVLCAALGGRQVDGDRDGLVRDTDVFFRLRGLCPDLQAGEVALALHAARGHVAPALLDGVEPSGLAIGGSMVSDREVAVRDFVGWVVNGGGGGPAPLPSPAGAGGSFAEAHMRRLGLTATGSASTPSAPGTPSSKGHSTGRDAWLASPTSFAAFRANWTARHGEAARRELESDAKRAAELPGPTWAAAGQSAFKVLHPKERPPLPSPSPRRAGPPPTPPAFPGTAATI